MYLIHAQQWFHFCNSVDPWNSRGLNCTGLICRFFSKNMYYNILHHSQLVESTDVGPLLQRPNYKVTGIFATAWRVSAPTPELFKVKNNSMCVNSQTLLTAYVVVGHGFPGLSLPMLYLCVISILFNVDFTFYLLSFNYFKQIHLWMKIMYIACVIFTIPRNNLGSKTL